MLVTTFLMPLGFYAVLAQSNSTENTFVDSETGFSFKYPYDWHLTSDKYLNTLFGTTSDSSNNLGNNNEAGTNVRPIAMVIPESVSGSAFFILSELLPFDLPIEKYFELTKANLLLDQTAHVSNPVLISISGLEGMKYNVTYDNKPDFQQTQMLFVNNSNGYVIASQAGSGDKNKDTNDLKFIISSLKFDNLSKN